MRNLLITTFGAYNHLGHWMCGDRNFDVALINYDNHRGDESLTDKCVYYDTFAIFKFPGIYDMFWDEPELLKYDYYFMPDEDIDLSTQDINTLFDKARTLNLSLCQPSIEDSESSYPSWKIFVHRDAMDFVATNFVEVQCPLFSRDALLKCHPTFIKSMSGYGLDLAWAKLIGANGNNIGFINSVVAKHTRKIGVGELYQKLKKVGVSPSRERKKLMSEYGIQIVDVKIL
jgi:hypothetical protein